MSLYQELRLSHKPSSSFCRYLIGHIAAPSSKGGKEMLCCVWATNCGFIRKEGENGFGVRNFVCYEVVTTVKLRLFASSSLQSFFQRVTFERNISPVPEASQSIQSFTEILVHEHHTPHITYTTLVTSLFLLSSQ